MNAIVKLFARAKDLVGREIIEVELPENPTVLDLKTALAKQYPQLEPIAAHLFVAINEDYANDQSKISSNATLACFPPVSGG